jgi:tRNA nucleotidyltransferase/poly(A) polymerase
MRWDKKKALVEKVSRERVGDEITKMIQGMSSLVARLFP